MARSFVPVALTANDLVEGDAVWWTGAAWSRRIADAAIHADEAAAAAAEAGLSGHGDVVVGLYRVEVYTTGGIPVPVIRREAIRAEGRPTFDYLPAPGVREAA